METNKVEVEAKFVIDVLQKKLLGFLCHFAGLFKVSEMRHLRKDLFVSKSSVSCLHVNSGYFRNEFIFTPPS